VAAKSLSGRIIAFHPTSSAFVPRKKCTPSTTQSVLSTRSLPRSCVSTTAQSSRGPATTAFPGERRGKSSLSSRSSPRSPSFMEKNLRKCKGGQGDRIEKRMHRHRDKNGAAPLVGDGETTSQNE